MAGLMDVIGLGILLKWKDQATAEMKNAERALGSLSEEADEAERKTAKLQASFAKLGKVGAGITAFGVGGAAALYGLARSASTFEDSLRDTMTMTGLTGDAFDDLNPDSREVVTGARVEPALAEVEPFQVVQFERLGYFAADPDTPMLFHRAVGLRDEWANIQKRQGK